MPRGKQSNNRKQYTPGYGSDAKPLFFSEKFRKADYEKVKALDAENPAWWIESIESMPESVSFSVKWSDQNECWQASFTFPLSAEGSGRKGLLIGRGSTKVGALTVAAYWYSTVPLVQMFPADDEDEDFLF